MAILGKYVRTIHVDKPTNIDVPDPSTAPAFELDMPQEVQPKPVEKVSALKKIFTKK